MRKLAKLELRPPEAAAAPSFAETMKRAGAVPLPEERRRVSPPPAHRASVRPKAPAAAPSFRVTDEDEWLEGYREGLSSRDRGRLRGVPGATLDLHGHDSNSARRALARFLAEEQKSGRERVLVIVGRGLHAPGGTGALRSSIGEWLSEPPLSSYVLAFARAPRERGGNGAVVVLLAPSTARGA